MAPSIQKPPASSAKLCAARPQASGRCAMTATSSGSGRRERTSLSRRSPVDKPAWPARRRSPPPRPPARRRRAAAREPPGAFAVALEALSRAGSSARRWAPGVRAGAARALALGRRRPGAWRACRRALASPTPTSRARRHGSSPGRPPRSAIGVGPRSSLAARRSCARGGAGGAPRAAARRAVARCGRVRGRFASTPPLVAPRCASVARCVGHGAHHCLRVPLGTSPPRCECARQTVVIDHDDALAWALEEKH